MFPILFTEDGHEYTLEGIHIPSVSELMSPILSDFEIDPKYAERGTAVHTLTELWDTDLYLPELADDELTPYMMAYEDFHDQHEVEVVEMEQIVFNQTLLYAGRLDRVWKIDGKLQLTDIKTGGKYKQHIFQLCAYQMALPQERCVLSNLYLNPFNFRLHTWKQEEQVYGYKMIEALSLIYWDNHRRDRKALDKIIAKGDVITELPF
jgi:hypothetical protein